MNKKEETVDLATVKVEINLPVETFEFLSEESNGNLEKVYY